MPVIPSKPARRRIALGTGTALFLAVAAGPLPAQGHQPPKKFYQGVTLSPDGERIGISAFIDGNLDVYTVRIDGSDFQRLTSDSVGELWESWAPDSKRLLYTVINPDKTMDLWLMRRDGSGKTRAPNGAGRGGYGSWSPDGKRVLLEREVDSVARIFVMDQNGANEHPVSSVSSGAGNPRWSLDGRRIAFETVAPNLPDQIYVVDADGSHQIQVTRDSLFSIFPTWTADGHVAFIRKGSLYVVNADGTGERLFRPGVFYAVFSRDGRRMAFLGKEPGAPGGMFSAHLYVADANGEHERRIPLPIDP